MGLRPTRAGMKMHEATFSEQGLKISGTGRRRTARWSRARIREIRILGQMEPFEALPT